MITDFARSYQACKIYEERRKEKRELKEKKVEGYSTTFLSDTTGTNCIVRLQTQLHMLTVLTILFLENAVLLSLFHYKVTSCILIQDSIGC